MNSENPDFEIREQINVKKVASFKVGEWYVILTSMKNDALRERAKGDENGRAIDKELMRLCTKICIQTGIKPWELERKLEKAGLVGKEDDN